MPDNFVHLHTHSEYSLLDGAARLEDLVIQAKEFGMPALALTDHGVMYGVIEFYQIAKKYGIKPIIGCEVYVAPGSRFDKTYRKDETPHHLVLLAENEEGYRNLMMLSTLGFLDGFYYKPRVDKEILKEYNQGLIALSACVSGELAKLVQERRTDEAKAKLKEYQDIFGKDNFFLEVQNQQLEKQVAINKALAELSRELDAPLVATNDIHYAHRSDYAAHDALLCIQTGSTLDEEERLKFGSDQFYMKSAEEMKAALPEFPEALANTFKIAERCNVEIDFGQIYLPHYESPDGYDLDSYLEKLCQEGVKSRYKEVTQDILDRLNYELKVIRKTGFSGYFLVVWDFVNFAKKQGIRVGPGRGSVAGSIVAYVLGITAVEPITNGLFFERFLNPERISMPDIDIDFDDERRDEVINYVTEKYGQDKVAQIVTFGTMKARAAIRDAGRVLNVPYSRVDKVAKLVPATPGVNTTIQDALKTVSQLREEYEKDDEVKQVIDTAEALEGLARHDSVHAAGVVISRETLPYHTPLQRKGEGEVVTQYPMEAIEKIGLLKMDFLGLRTLTVIGGTLKIIKRTQEKNIDIDLVPFNDKKTYEMLRKGESVGVFQLESAGMRSLLKDLAPNSFEDIMNLLALYRPGPLDSGMVSDFVDRRRGLKPISYPHPSLESVLKSTYGTIVYQEQVMQIAVKMAGFSMGEADILRKAMAKPNPQVFSEQREMFIQGALEKEIDASTSGRVFDLVAHFAGYGFNRSHSCGYAVIAYQTAYLKANYPVEFMAALLTSETGNKDKIAQHVNECRRMGIEVLPPDVNESYRDFTVVNVGGKSDSSGVTRPVIRFGLSAVRNIGEGAVEAVLAARKTKSEFTSIYDLCQKVDMRVINKRAIESLIKSGCFDSLSHGRKALLGIYEQAVDAGIKKQKDDEIGQSTFFDLSGEKESFFEQPEARIEDEEEFPKEQLLAYEKEMLGLFVSDHPLWGKEKLLRSKTHASLAELKEQKDGSVVWLGGIITRITRITTKKGENMLFVSLEDLEGTVETIVFPKVYQTHREILNEDSVILVKGRIDIKEDAVKVIAQEIRNLEDGSEIHNQAEIKKNNDSILISVSEKEFTPEMADQIKKILLTHPGPRSVFLKLKNDKEDTTLCLGPEYTVNDGGGLFGELKALLGDGTVSLRQ